MRGGQHVACQFRDIKKAHLKKGVLLIIGVRILALRTWDIPGNFFDEKF